MFRFIKKKRYIIILYNDNIDQFNIIILYIDYFFK